MNSIERLVLEQLNASEAQLGHMIQLGDDPSIVRPVDHNLVFDDFATAQSAEAEFLRNGYKTKLWTDGEIFLDIQKESALDHDALSAALHDVLAILVAHKFEYDGWGAPIKR